MKKLYTIITLILFSNTLISQTSPIETESKAPNIGAEIGIIKNQLDSLKNVVKTAKDSINEKFKKIGEKLVRFGVSIGYNAIYKDQLKKYQSASIDLKDTTLKLETMDPYSIKVSTSIIVTPLINSEWLKKTREANKNKIDFLKSKRKNLYEQKVTMLTRKGAPSKARRKDVRDSIPKMQNIKLFAYNIKSFFLYVIQNSGITANINMLEFNKAQSNLAFNKNMEGGIGFCLSLHEKIFLSYSNEVYFSRQLRENIKKYENQKLHVDGKIVTSINDLNVNDENLFITRNVIANSFKVIIIF